MGQAKKHAQKHVQIRVARALRALRERRMELVTWELWLLLLLMVTVFGIAARGPMGDLPSMLSSIQTYRFQQLDQDPYDVHQEFGGGSGEARNNVETGL